MNIQGWSPLGLTGLFSLLSKGLSRVFSSTTVWKHQFFSTQPCLWSNSHMCTSFLESYLNVFFSWLSAFVNLIGRFPITEPKGWRKCFPHQQFQELTCYYCSLNPSSPCLSVLSVIWLGRTPVSYETDDPSPHHPLQGSQCCTAQWSCYFY